MYHENVFCLVGCRVNYPFPSHTRNIESSDFRLLPPSPSVGPHGFFCFNARSHQGAANTRVIGTNAERTPPTRSMFSECVGSICPFCHPTANWARLLTERSFSMPNRLLNMMFQEFSNQNLGFLAYGFQSYMSNFPHSPLYP